MKYSSHRKINSLTITKRKKKALLIHFQDKNILFLLYTKIKYMHIQRVPTISSLFDIEINMLINEKSLSHSNTIAKKLKN